MKVAIPIWQGKVSSVFDFAHTLLLVELENGIEKERKEIELADKSGLKRADILKRLGVRVLICGAISRPLADMIHSLQIRILPCVTGSTEEILNAYKTGQLDFPKYAMPGCWKGAHRGCHRHRGWRDSLR
jgi:predicted Fe-Mo cluster-binding NifX family protein